MMGTIFCGSTLRLILMMIINAYLRICSFAYWRICVFAYLRICTVYLHKHGQTHFHRVTEVFIENCHHRHQRERLDSEVIFVLQ